ncbi:MAG: sensor histidine kinase [Actinomycetota bacterium]
MSGQTPVTPEGVAGLEERLRKLAQEKSYLQLIIHMMNRLGSVADLDECLGAILNGLVETIGGTDAQLAVFVDDRVRRHDLMGADEVVDTLDDPLMMEAVELKKAFAVASDFSATRLTSPAFERAWTWVVPLQVGSEVIGVFKLVDTHVSLNEMSTVMPTLFSYMAMTLKNAVASHAKLQEAYARLREANQALAAVNDGLERQVAERTAELVRRNEELSLTQFVVDNASEAIFRLTPGGQIIYGNSAACQIAGRPLDELLTLNVWDLNPSHTQATWSEHWHKLEQSRTMLFEAILVRGDGTTVPVEIRANIVTYGNQSFNVSFVRDISERQAAERRARRMVEALVRSNADLERFAYVASHDLQEPVRTVVSFSQLLERRLGDRLTADDREVLAFLVNGAKRMGELVQDLLAYSRVTNRQAPRADVDLGAVVADAMDNLRSLIDERGVAVEVGPMPTLPGDRIQLIELFQNLISNSAKFTQPGTRPHIRIAAIREDGCWHVSVADNGIGIAPEYFEHVFVIFQRLHAGDIYPGTGVGLAVCKRIVEQHGGRIWVESEPGAGAIFHFTLADAVGPDQE